MKPQPANKTLFLLRVIIVFVFVAVIASFSINTKEGFTHSQKSDFQHGNITAAGDDLEELVADFCKKSKEGKFSELDELMTRFSDVRPSITKDTKKKDTASASENKKSENEKEIIWDEDYQLFNKVAAESEYNFVKNISKTIFKRQYSIIELKTNKPEENQAKVCASLNSDILKSQFMVADFYLVKKENESWKIFQIELRVPTETNCE